MTVLQHLRRAIPQTCRKVVGCQGASLISTQFSQRYFVSATSLLLEKKTIKVPTMGDSITEGTIVEWTAAIGQAVKEDDVVAMIETDKVTVEIKAEVDGVVIQHFGEVDDNVEVGADLYEIDTEAEATVFESASSSQEEQKPDEPAQPESSTEEVAVAAASSGTDAAHRTPSIQFLGKDGWARRLSGEDAEASPDTVLVGYHAMYGRPSFSEEEMEALILGGATLEPEVVAEVGWAQLGH